MQVVFEQVQDKLFIHHKLRDVGLIKFEKLLMERDSSKRNLKEMRK
jgi:hypothetical protein